jgi:pyruvate carboxylase
MGDKTAARGLAKKIGVPVLPGTEEPIEEREKALKVAQEIGFPLIIKAAFGGGGSAVGPVSVWQLVSPIRKPVLAQWAVMPA